MDSLTKNTDRELYTDDTGSIRAVVGGGIGIKVGSLVIVKPLRTWHANQAFADTKNNICTLLRDAWRILDDGPDDSDRAMADAKIGEALALARIVCKEEPLP